MSYKCDCTSKIECDGCMTCKQSAPGEEYKPCTDCQNEFSSYVLTETEIGMLCPKCLEKYIGGEGYVR